MSDTKTKVITVLFIIRIIVASFVIYVSIEDIVCSKKNPTLYEQVYTSEMLGKYKVTDLEEFVKREVISCIVSLLYIVITIIQYRYSENKWLALIVYMFDILIVSHFFIVICSNEIG